MLAVISSSLMLLQMKRSWNKCKFFCIIIFVWDSSENFIDQKPFSKFFPWDNFMEVKFGI